MVSDERAVRVGVAFARQAGTAPGSRLCSACVDVMHVTGAGVTIMSGRHSGPVCSSNDRVRRLEDLQFSLGEGPCHDAFVTGKPVSEPDLAVRPAHTWMNYAAPALALGACAVFAFPLHVGGRVVGVLTLYQDDVGPRSDQQTADGIVVAGTHVFAYLGDSSVLFGRPDQRIHAFRAIELDPQNAGIFGFV